MFTGRLSDKVKYKTIVKHKEKNHEQIIVDGEVYIEHRFLKKTIKIEDGKLTILPPDAPIEAGAEVYNATGRRVWNYSSMYKSGTGDEKSNHSCTLCQYRSLFWK